jgi:Ca2+-binding EF-hand superfamily protein
LKSKYKYNEESDCFINITTKFLPLVSEFIKFWENTMIFVLNNNNSDDNENNKNNKKMICDFEIDEICHLFKHWKDSSISGNINEQDVIKILKHFFPNVELIDDKFVINFKSNLFDKDSDIFISLNQLKEEYKNKQKNLLNNNLVHQFDSVTNNTNQLISFEEAYTFYNIYMNSELKNNNTYNFKFIVSKNYFEKYIINNLSEYIIYDNFITNEWYL